MTTSAATVHTNYASAITALELVVADVLDPSTGILATETLGASISGFERDALAKAAENCSKALQLLQDNTLEQLAGAAY